jgi:glycosyltransferase involved in cell wall biosynthesis
MQGETVLCIAPRSWRSLWRETQPIMSRFAAQNRVLYFEPGRDAERHVFAEMIRNLPNFLVLRTQEVQEGLIVIPTPSSLPHARRHLPRSVLRVTMPVVIKINAWILIRHVRWAMKALNVESPILWLYGPYEIDLIGKFGEKLACYHNYDEFAHFTYNARVKDLLQRLDDQLSSKVDIVFASSRAQCERRKAVNANTYFVPNGVDFELFNRALNPDLVQPADIAAAPRPIIGFAGWLGYHIDVELLRRVAEASPNCSLVLVGPDALPSTEGRKRLCSLPNVFFLGRKERFQLPSYLGCFDVALMPYSLSGHILSAYPLKLHEYLAAGRAIVSTALPELQPYSHVVRIAETYDQFIAHIQEAIHDYTAQAVETRVTVARENTWDRRVADVYRIMQNRLSRVEE